LFARISLSKLSIWNQHLQSVVRALTTKNIFLISIWLVGMPKFFCVNIVTMGNLCSFCPAPCHNTIANFRMFCHIFLYLKSNIKTNMLYMVIFLINKIYTFNKISKLVLIKTNGLKNEIKITYLVLIGVYNFLGLK